LKWAPAARQPGPRLKVLALPVRAARFSLAPLATGRSGEQNSVARPGVALNQDYARGHEPLSALQGGEGGA